MRASRLDSRLAARPPRDAGGRGFMGNSAGVRQRERLAQLVPEARRCAAARAWRDDDTASAPGDPYPAFPHWTCSPAPGGLILCPHWNIILSDTIQEIRAMTRTKDIIR